MALEEKLVTPAAGSVVTLNEFKEHLRWPSADTSEDTTMARKLSAAVEDFKDFTGRPILTETWRVYLDSFPTRVNLPKAPVDVASIVISYYDVNDDLQVLASSEYTIIDGGIDFSSINFDGTIPATYDKDQAVYIDYDAGWDTVPDKIVVGICEQAADYFEYRTSGDARIPLVPKAYRAWYSYKLFYNNCF